MNNFFIGIDIGGTHIRIATYDEALGSMSDIKKVKFKKSGICELEVIENICELITSTVEEKKYENKELRGIGLSLAALFERSTGNIVIWPNNKVWNGFELKNYLHTRFNVPIIMEDDANSAAYGEKLEGAGKGHDNLAYISIGTGVGCGLILNNTLITGENGWAGEIGHIKVLDDGPECKCGRKGCLQSLVSGPALLKRFKEVRKNSCRDAELTQLSEVSTLANNGDLDAIEVFSQAGMYIGREISNIVMMLDISVFVIGGGVAEVGNILLEPVRKTVGQHLNCFKREIKIEKSTLVDINGVIGALGLIYKYVYNRELNLGFINNNEKGIAENDC